MPFRQWLRSPRRLLGLFLAVVLTLGAALGWLGRRKSWPSSNRGYGRAFFWDGRVGLTVEDPSRALASYVRSILSGDSLYDRFVN